jgi:hypothetical protein
MTGITAYPKTVFSMLILEVEEKLKELSDVKSIVLFGIEVRHETHLINCCLIKLPHKKNTSGLQAETPSLISRHYNL